MRFVRFAYGRAGCALLPVEGAGANRFLEEDTMETSLSRRGFLTGAAVTGALTAMGLAGCAPQVSAEGNAKADRKSVV